MSEADQLRATLRQIAEQATQSVDTECGGQILRQIEALARGALLQSPGLKTRRESVPGVGACPRCQSPWYADAIRL